MFSGFSGFSGFVKGCTGQVSLRTTAQVVHVTRKGGPIRQCNACSACRSEAQLLPGAAARQAPPRLVARLPSCTARAERDYSNVLCRDHAKYFVTIRFHAADLHAQPGRPANPVRDLCRDLPQVPYHCPHGLCRPHDGTACIAMLLLLLTQQQTLRGGLCVHPSLRRTFPESPFADDNSSGIDACCFRSFLLRRNSGHHRYIGLSDHHILHYVVTAACLLQIGNLFALARRNRY